MSNLIAKIPDPAPLARKTLILAHRTELLDQAQAQIQRYNPSWRVVVDQGNRKPDIDAADVVVASVQTLGRSAATTRLERYDPQQFKTIMIDEVHHAAANTYTNILDYFDTFAADNHIFVWGCSATVRRHDGIALEGIFDKIVYHMDLLHMIEAGWLCPIKVTTVETQVDLSKVHTRYDDFMQSQLARAVNVEQRNKTIYQSWTKFAATTERRSTLVFAVDMAHTIALCNLFRSHGVDADYVTSKTPTLTRYETLQRFRNGEFPVLVNCGILTEGTDIPRIDCILMARPTKSNVLFQQMFGRGMRLYPEKQDCLVIDFVDNFSKAGSEGLVTFPTLMGLDHNQVVRDENVLDMERRAVAQANQQHVGEEDATAANADDEEEEDDDDQHHQDIRVKITEYDDLNEFMLESSVSPELHAVTPNSWVTVGQNKCALSILSFGTVRLEQSDKDGLWRGTLTRETRNARASSDSSNDTTTTRNSSGKQKPVFRRRQKLPLTADTRATAIRAADTWLNQNISQQQQFMVRRTAAYRRHPATDAQIKMLKRQHVEPKQSLTKGQAMDLITRMVMGQRKIWQKERDKLVEYKKQQAKKQERAVLLRSAASSST
ncbi:P-loop containing nucleoside triphosphate hydrolase protein [Zychaea mexicana]|uniref:P-loop containing nucleoside triphosphate hydrolase protein n=1 Tax=Zychaea mexicana TaxID=64656 RepID=UPI0022FED349|nr:P-loop containing nucleoside triphosphate hydrolase protein [Zychaea mexicana]KAI9488383.1 P-loop containing nucleoside triphosphate hydrolase protein [Zychaea mexicana]